MVRYICMYCGAGGASGGKHHESPPSYHCHVCEKRDAMFPAKVVEQLQRTEYARDRALQDATNQRDRAVCAEMERDELRKLAYIGEHMHEDYSWKARFTELKEERDALAAYVEACKPVIHAYANACFFDEGKESVKELAEQLDRQAPETGLAKINPQ